MFQKIISFWDNTSFHLNRVAYYVGFGAAALFILSYFAPGFFTVAIAILLFTSISVLIDAILLYQKRKGMEAIRVLNERLSNGDENKILLQLKNNYDFKIQATVIDELPYQFQERNWKKII